MTTATTAQEGYTTVSQAGSDVSWNDLSNMPYPTEGEAYASLSASSQASNVVSLAVPQEASGIPNGATFDSFKFSLNIKKTGTLSSATNLEWYFGFSIGSYRLQTQTNDETYEWITSSGDSSFWGISSAWSPAAIIAGLKDGSVYLRFKTNTTDAVACSAYCKAATCTITYTTVEGKRGAIILAIL